MLPESGILSFPAVAAGCVKALAVGMQTVVKGGQKRITCEIEDCAFLQLQSAINNLPLGDPRQIAFRNSDQLSTQFIASIPTDRDLLGSLDLSLAFSEYYGLENDLFLPYKVRNVKGRPLDGFGHVLTNAALEGDGWRKKHDALKWIFDG